MSLVVATKCCTKCGEMKPASAFYRNRSTKDGLQGHCKQCASEDVAARAARRRAEMGEEAWLAHQAEITRRSRERRGMAAERAYSKAVREATSALVARHRREYDHLLLLARRGELDAAGLTA